MLQEKGGIIDEDSIYFVMWRKDLNGYRHVGGKLLDK